MNKYANKKPSKNDSKFFLTTNHVFILFLILSFMLFGCTNKNHNNINTANTKQSINKITKNNTYSNLSFDFNKTVENSKSYIKISPIFNLLQGKNIELIKIEKSNLNCQFCYNLHFSFESNLDSNKKYNVILYTKNNVVINSTFDSIVNS